MALSSYESNANNPIAVIGSQYCGPYPVDLVISRKVKKLKDGEFVVSDVNGNLMLKAKDKVWGMHSKRVLLDAAGNDTLVTLREKIITEHSRWNVFRGESTNDKDVLFTVKNIPKTKFAVFLANNRSNEKVCDFIIEGSWSDRSCVIYAGDSSTIVAQMHKNITTGSLLIGEDNFMVTIYPNVDQAFIVSLIVILDAINKPYDPAAIGAAAGAAAAGGATVVTAAGSC